VCVCVFFAFVLCVPVCVREGARGSSGATTANRRRNIVRVHTIIISRGTVPALPGKWFQAAFLRRTPKNVLDRSPPIVLYYKLTHTVRHICTRACGI